MYELLMCQPGIPVQVKTPDDRSALGRGQLRLVLLEEKVYTLRVDVAIAPGVKASDQGVL